MTEKKKQTKEKGFSKRENINDSEKTKVPIIKKKIVKDSFKKVKIPTDIEGFDEITNGGLEKNTSNLLVGDAGSGKTIFAMEFLINGIKRKESCLYITFEEEKMSFYNNMREFGWDLSKLEKEGNFFFLHYNPKKVKTMLEEGGGIIENIVLKNKINRIVIDSVTSFVVLFEKEIEKREAVLSLFNMLKKWNCTTMLTYEGDPLKKALDSKIMEFEADSITFLYFLRMEKERMRFLEVIKMRGSKHSKSVYPFSIDKGIIIGRKPFIGNLRV